MVGDQLKLQVPVAFVLEKTSSTSERPVVFLFIVVFLMLSCLFRPIPDRPVHRQQLTGGELIELLLNLNIGVG